MTQRPGEQERPWEGPSEVPQDWGQAAPPPLPGPSPHGPGGPTEIVPGQVGPSPVPQYGAAGGPPARRESEEVWSAFGDVVRKGRWSASRRSTFIQIFGDVKLDLRDVIQPGETLEVTTWSLFGDVRIAVPPGTEVEVNGGTVFGDVKAESDPGGGPAPRTGARLVVTVNSVFGEVRVREIVPGDVPKRWRWLRVA